MDGNGARKYQSKDNAPPLVERSRLKRLHYRTRCSVAPRVWHPPSGSYVEEESPHAAVPSAPRGKPDAENQGRASTLLAFGSALGKAVEELEVLEDEGVSESEGGDAAGAVCCGLACSIMRIQRSVPELLV